MPFGDRVGLLRGGAMIRWLKTGVHECKSVCLWCHAETDMISYNLLHIVVCHVRTSFCVCVCVSRDVFIALVQLRLFSFLAFRCLALCPYFAKNSSG